MTEIKRMSAEELDKAATRLDEIGAEEDKLRAKLKEQIEAHGFTPPRAEKSKRLLGNVYQFTLSTSSQTELNDAEIEKIRESTPVGIFAALFYSVPKWKLAKDALKFLAGALPDDAPRNLRQKFAKAVVISEKAPSLSVKKLEAA